MIVLLMPPLYRFNASHASYVSHPEEITDLILNTTKGSTE
jgi:hypothetical protein